MAGKTVTLRVGESTLLIDGECVDYESTFSFNDRIATVSPQGRVTATGIGTTRILVNRGVDKAGNYRDYYCTINVVAGTAPACKHQWMDTNEFASNGKNKSCVFFRKIERAEAFTMCRTCGEKFLTNDDLIKHRDKMREKGADHSGSYQEGEGTLRNFGKWSYDYYCSKCGLEKQIAIGALREKLLAPLCKILSLTVVERKNRCIPYVCGDKEVLTITYY